MQNPATPQAAPNRLIPVPHRAKCWENIRVEQFQLPEGEGGEQYEGQHTLYMSLNPRPIDYYLQSGDNQTFTGQFGKGDLSFAPANLPFLGRWKEEDRFVRIQLADDFVNRVARETLNRDGDRLEFVPEFKMRDGQLEAISTMLQTELHQQQSSGALYVDSLANILAVHLLRHQTTTRSQLPSYEGGLAPHQLRRIVDYIDAYLDRDIKLTDLAESVGMSQFHFGRLFKQSVGISPYQYLIQQRVERAKLLLQQTQKPIVDIAFDCGFNSHSHLSKQFRQLTGTTPKAYRTSR